ncbi:hypothetical protein AAHE18_01G205700 [Arachis hypogaea]
MQHMRQYVTIVLSWCLFANCATHSHSQPHCKPPIFFLIALLDPYFLLSSCVLTSNATHRRTILP